MIRAIALSVALLAAGPSAATPEYVLPTLFDVAGVAADDRLNVRDRPGMGGEVVSTLAPDARAIEIVEERAGWGRVLTGEGSGWVSLRRVVPRVDVWPESGLPGAWSCHGTEPFWSLHVADGAAIWDTPEGRQTLGPATVLTTGAFRDPTRAVVAPGLTLTSVPGLCGNGMSDHVFGLAAQAVLTGATGAPVLLTGCCRISAAGG